MSHHVPTAAGVLTIVGGVFILLAGAALAAIGSFLAFFIGGIAYLFYIGLVVGIITLVMGILMLVMPQMKTAWGAITIVLAIVSLPTALGGFIVGFILALLGGIFAITYKVAAQPMGSMGMPGMPMPPMAAAPMMGGPLPAVCPSCGGANINAATRTCMNCGRTL
ncbi:MAG: DUF6114 domain-containing protein [Thermoplasmata archaeon]|nr:DUF6114 domain-containing protein [Thermoplasmata archaeon]